MKAFSSDLESVIAAVNDALEKGLPQPTVHPELIHAGMRYAVFPGGKRLRPILCLAAAKAIDSKQYMKALLPAVAVELLHSYTLVHDDLPAMDNDMLRRGKPTVHVQFGEAAAILIGDALLTLVFDVLAQTGDTALIREMSLAAGSAGVIAGQMDDINLQTGNSKITPILLRSIYTKKTAALFVASVRMGAITQGASAKDLAALTVYAEKLGIAFQYIDDILDDDPYMLQVLSRKAAEKKVTRFISDAIQELDSIEGDTHMLRELADLIKSQLV